jgi:hypothetical protein
LKPTSNKTKADNKSSAIGAAVSQGKKVTVLATPTPAENGLDGDLESGSEDEESVAEIASPSRRPMSARQLKLRDDPKAGLKIQRKKARIDKMTAAAAEAAAAKQDGLQMTTAEPQKATARNATKKLVTRKPAPRKSAASKTPAKISRAPTAQKGKITEDAANVDQPQEKPYRRPHRKVNIPYHSASELSEDDGKNDSCVKLRATVNRHARWCPYVKLNKKIHNMYRKIRDLESAAYEGDGDVKVEIEEDVEEGIKEEEDDEDEEDEDEDEGEGMTVIEIDGDDVGGDDGQQPKEAQLATQTASVALTKIAGTETAANKRVSFAEVPLKEAAPSKTTNASGAHFTAVNAKDSDSDTALSSEESASDQDEVRSNVEGAPLASEISSDEDETVKSLIGDELQQAEEAFRQVTATDRNDIASDLSSANSADTVVGKKRKGTGPDKGKAKGKKQKSEEGETVSGE